MNQQTGRIIGYEELEQLHRRVFDGAGRADGAVRTKPRSSRKHSGPGMTSRERRFQKAQRADVQQDLP